MNKLNFLTAGKPLRSQDGGYEKAFKDIVEMNLDGIEIEFVHGVRITKETIDLIKKVTEENNLITTAHGPYYINLNAKEPEKRQASIERILQTAQAAASFGGFSITYHAAFYLGMEKSKVFQTVVETTNEIVEALKKEDNNIWIRPETTGKPTQWGDLEEIVTLSKEFKQVLPCVDFSHLHARTNGGYNTYSDFAKIFEYIGNELGTNALNNFHAHLAGIEYTVKGEKKHLPLEESDMNYKDLMKAFKDFDVKGALICESPNIEEDAMLLKAYYSSL